MTKPKVAQRGLNATVRIQYHEPGIEMTYIKQSGESNGDAGDQYTGLDRFGRIVDIRWLKTSSEAGLERVQYGFDRAGNRKWRDTPMMPIEFGEQYLYDGLYQLDDRKRGTLDSSGVVTGTPEREEDFSYDPTGNWSHYQAKTEGTTTLNQSRAHNQANEITAIDSLSSSVGYDAAGNMTKMPEVANWGASQTMVWDAWDRLVRINSSSHTLAIYRYDALARRIHKDATGSGQPATRQYYYSDQWQVIEERAGVEVEASEQYVWGLRYADDLILRDRFATGSGSSSKSATIATEVPK